MFEGEADIFCESMVDVLIIGGGVIGLSSAWRLAQSGLKVRLIDRGEIGREASWAGAGIIPPGLMGDATSPLGRLYHRSKRLWPEWSAELSELTGIDNGYARCGGIEVVEDEAALQTELAEWHAIDEPAEALDAASLVQREPHLHVADRHAYYLPGLAQVRNPWHLRALQAACRQSGVEIVPNQEVRFIVCEGKYVLRCATDDGVHEAGQYLITAGAWSQQLLQSVGVTLNIEPIRGQIVLLTGVPRLLKHVIEQGARYIVPRSDGRILVGSTEERAGFDKSTTTEGIAGLMQFAASLVPELVNLPVEQTWAGLRPYLADGPFVGRAGDIDNLYIAAGHFRSGLTLSPATALAIVEELGVRSRESWYPTR
jgi:glycine oxidase